MKFYSTAATILAICTLTSATAIPLQERQDMTAAAMSEASASIATAFAAPEAKGKGGLASDIVQTVADGLGLGTLQGSIVNSVAAGLRNNGL